jgi:hypothetical protein
MKCPGVTSAVNPGRPLRLCLGCVRYEWGMDGTGPAKHDGKVWTCKQLEAA